MRRQLLPLLWIGLAAATALAGSVPATLYSGQPSVPNTGFCYATAPTVMTDPSSAFMSLACSVGKTVMPYMVSLNFYAGTSTVVASSTHLTNAAFSNAPIPVDRGSVLLYTTAANKGNEVDYVSGSGTLWKYPRNGATAGVAYDKMNQICFTTVDSNPSLLVALGVNATTPDYPQEWWIANITTSVAVGNVIFYENNVYMMLTGNQLLAINATSHAPLINPVTPCGLTIQGTAQINLVNMGSDANGPLDALLVLANTSVSGGSALQFSVCRVHHGAYGGGKAEWIANFPGDFVVYAVTGSPAGNTSLPGYIFLSVYNTTTMQYAVIQMAANGSVIRTYLRDAADKYSSAAVLLPPLGFGNNPLVVMQVNGAAVAYDVDTGASQWTQNFACTFTPSTFFHGGDPVVLCVQQSTITLMNFHGGIIWQAAVKTRVQPTVFADSFLVVTAMEPLGVQVLTFTVGPPAPPPSSTGPSAGIVVLIIFLIIFVVLLGGAGFKLYKQRAIRRVVTKGQLDNEGYAGLNA